MSIAPWSFSRIKSFEQCPKQFYHMKIAKDYHEGETEAMRYGTEAHLVAEEFIRDGKPVPDKFAYMKDPLEALSRRRGNKLTEIKMGLTADLEPCEFRAKNVWWRGIADLVIMDGTTAWVVDYKTSKSAKYADKGQLELMAMATFKHFPEVVQVKVATAVADAVPEEPYLVAQAARRASVIKPIPVTLGVVVDPVTAADKTAVTVLLPTSKVIISSVPIP